MLERGAVKPRRTRPPMGTDSTLTVRFSKPREVYPVTSENFLVITGELNLSRHPTAGCPSACVMLVPVGQPKDQCWRVISCALHLLAKRSERNLQRNAAYHPRPLLGRSLLNSRGAISSASSSSGSEWGNSCPLTQTFPIFRR